MCMFREREWEDRQDRHRQTDWQTETKTDTKRQTKTEINFVAVILRADGPRFQSYSNGVRSVVERRARVRRVSGSIPGRSGGRMFLSGKKTIFEDVPLVEFGYLVFINRMEWVNNCWWGWQNRTDLGMNNRKPGDSYCSWHRSLLSCLCDLFRALINRLVCFHL